MYYHGCGVPKDYHKAFEYYLKGAEGGHEKSLIAVGKLFIFIYKPSTHTSIF